MEEFLKSLKFSILLVKLSGFFHDNNILLTLVIVISTLAHALPISIAWLDIMNYPSDVSIYQDFICRAANTVQFIFYTSAAVSKYRVLKVIMESLKKCWSLDHNGKKLEKLQMNVYRFIYINIKFTYALAITSVIVIPIFKSKLFHTNGIRAEIWFQFPMRELLNVSHVICYVQHLNMFFALPGLFNALVVFCYFQMRMLRVSIQNFDFMNKNKKEETQVYSQLVEYYKYFMIIYRLFKNVNEFFSFVIFIQFYMVILNYCTYMYPVFKYSNLSLDTFFTSVGVLVIVLSQLYIACFIIGLYSDEYQKVAYAIYQANWADNKISSRIKMAILMIMQKSQRGQDFIAGKLMVINRSTFVSIMQLCFSYYTIVDTITAKQHEKAHV